MFYVRWKNLQAKTVKFGRAGAVDIHSSLDWFPGPSNRNVVICLFRLRGLDKVI